MIEYFYLFGAIILWGTYLVPIKKMKADIRYSQFIVCSAILATTVLISLFMGFGMEVTWFGLASGLMWGFGNCFSLMAIERIGISRAFPLWISSVLVAYAWGVLFFSEITGLGIAAGLIGALMVMAGSVIITKTRKQNEKPILTGALFAFVTALLFGTQFVPFKLSGISPGNYIFQMSLGIFISSLAIFLSKSKIQIPKERQLKNGVLAGVLWSAANFLGIYVVDFFGVAKSSPLTQACVIIGVLWGLFYFREFEGRKAAWRIIAGTLVILSGVILVGTA
jgi:glucose uptake protein